MRFEDPYQREFYENECIRGNWSVRQLDRQIQSLLYERTALSKKKTTVIAKAHENPIVIRPEDEIKDPYVLEFPGLKDEYSESQLEEAFIHHLEEFLLELGIGFTFVARQKRITIGKQHFRLDLLLYHRVLKCKIFASKYKLQLPDPKMLQAEIESEKQKLLEMKIVKECATICTFWRSCEFGKS
jgi:predicted nuclease of restriction endonuclease-like (RecB) superfamily